MQPGSIAFNLSNAVPKGAKCGGIKPEARFCSGAVADSVYFAGMEKIPERKKLFWATVNRAALGGKHAGGWRKVLGLFAYPYQLLKHAVLWLLGKKEGFKTLHPLAKESRSQVIDRIEALNREIKAPDLRFNFSSAEIEKADVHKNYLLKIHDSLLGLKNLLAVKDWDSTAQALEQFLSANGKNNSKSCANISITHAHKLANGSPMKRLKLKEAEVVGVARRGETVDTILLPTQEFKNAFDINFQDVTPEGKSQIIKDAESNLVQKFGIKSAVQKVNTPQDIELALKKAGNRSQALIFNLIGSNDGHVTLAVNIKNRIYHIDNWNTQSAKVSQLLDWADAKKSNALWYAILKDEIHPAITKI